MYQMYDTRKRKNKKGSKMVAYKYPQKITLAMYKETVKSIRNKNRYTPGVMDYNQFLSLYRKEGFTQGMTQDEFISESSLGKCEGTGLYGVLGEDVHPFGFGDGDSVMAIIDEECQLTAICNRGSHRWCYFDNNGEIAVALYHNNVGMQYFSDSTVTSSTALLRAWNYAQKYL